MTFRLIFEPGKTVKWKDFMHYPPYSIAIDGYCEGPPRATSDSRILNINHHEGCDRIATRSSCAQALHLVKMGLFDTFHVGGKKVGTGFCNDCDQDVQWATYILKHSCHVDRPRLKALVQLADLLDMSAGFYPIKKRWHLLKMLLWVSEPYTDLRANGLVENLSAVEMEVLIEATHRRIRATLFGKGKETEPDTQFEVIEDFPGWSFIREVGPHARIGVAQAGIKACVVFKGSVGQRFHYVILRRSCFIQALPLRLICNRLNEAEDIGLYYAQRWGGSFDTAIGSPRKIGSKLPPERVIEIVKEISKETLAHHHSLRRDSIRDLAHTPIL